jgi:putative ABC transport system permease protein
MGVAVPASRLTARDMVRVVALGLRTRRLRAILSGLGVAVGIASMVAVLGLSASSRADLLATLDRLGTNLVRVSPGQSFLGEDATLPEPAEEMIRRIGPVQAVTAVRDVEANVYRNEYVPEFETNGIAVAASDPNLLATLRGRIRHGRFLNAATAGYPTVVVGSVAARRLGIDDVAGRARLLVGGRCFTVIGVLEPLPLAPDLDRSAIIGRPVAEELLGADRSASTIYVRADPEDVKAVMGVLAATANPERAEEVEVAQPSEALAARAAAKGAFTSLFLGLGAVALLVGGVGIANIMVISVLERRSEIGLRRALGATRWHVGAQFLAESLALAGAGGLAGVVLGVATTIVYAWSRGWLVDIPTTALIGGVTASLLLGAVAGLYPAVRAARLSPTDALRSV